MKFFNNISYFIVEKLDKLAEYLAKEEWVQYSVCNNAWLWFHTLAGGLIARVFKYFSILLGWYGVAAILITAVLWKIAENHYFATKFGDKWETVVYGSPKRSTYNAIGGIVMPVIHAALVLI